MLQGGCRRITSEQQGKLGVASIDLPEAKKFLIKRSSFGEIAVPRIILKYLRTEYSVGSTGDINGLKPLNGVLPSSRNYYYAY